MEGGCIRPILGRRTVPWPTLGRSLPAFLPPRPETKRSEPAGDCSTLRVSQAPFTETPRAAGLRTFGPFWGSSSGPLGWVLQLRVRRAVDARVSTRWTVRVSTRASAGLGPTSGGSVDGWSRSVVVYRVLAVFWVAGVKLKVSGGHSDWTSLFFSLVLT